MARKPLGPGGSSSPRNPLSPARIGCTGRFFHEKKFRKKWERLSPFFKNIPSVEQVLLLLMLLLFVQFFIVLTEKEPHDAEAIDVVMRSMAATIFGYFIGGKLGESAEGKSDKTDAVSQRSIAKDAGNQAPVAKIGFVSEPSAEASASKDSPPPPKARRISLRESSLQIRIVGGIGFVSLLILFLVRDVEALGRILETQSGIATISQLRDFAAGSIGFLVSATKNR